MKTVSSIFVRLAFLVGIGAVWGCGHHSASQLPAVLPPTLIVPPHATRHMTRGRLPAAWSLGLAGYAVGLVLSTAFDLPSGPLILWVLVLFALGWQALVSRVRKK